ADRSDRGVADVLGAVDVGEALAEVDGAGPCGELRHLGENRRGHGARRREEARPTGDVDPTVVTHGSILAPTGAARHRRPPADPRRPGTARPRARRPAARGSVARPGTPV